MSYAPEILLATEYLKHLNIIYRNLDLEEHVKLTCFDLSKNELFVYTSPASSATPDSLPMSSQFSTHSHFLQPPHTSIAFSKTQHATTAPSPSRRRPRTRQRSTPAPQQQNVNSNNRQKSHHEFRRHNNASHTQANTFAATEP